VPFERHYDRAAMAARSPQHAALGQAVRQLRRAGGLSQEAFAASCRLHRTYIGGIERGERNVSFANLLRIADALDVRPSVLLERYEDCLREMAPPAGRGSRRSTS
jgi:transcriptional regulator with XRE-family HTH domain